MPCQKNQVRVLVSGNQRNSRRRVVFARLCGGRDAPHRNQCQRNATGQAFHHLRFDISCNQHCRITGVTNQRHRVSRSRFVFAISTYQ